VGVHSDRCAQVRSSVSKRREHDQSKVDLYELGRAGYAVVRPKDLDWEFRPWLIDGDGNIWIYDAGMPASGYKASTHSVFVNDDGTWTYLTAAAASGRKDAPKDRASLEQRARHAEQQAQRQATERERNLSALRKAAVPVTSGDIDQALQFTLREAADRIDQAGGKIEADGDRLVVSLPPGAGKTWGSTGPLDAARVLYLAESFVVAALKRGDKLPDAPCTPAGHVLAS
jgi:hypothetical protein